MKINLSKIFRYILILIINMLCIFVLQYYINSQLDVSQSLSNLKIAIFFNNSTETSEEEILDKISKLNIFTNIDIINSANHDKFAEINPELNDIIPNEVISFPSFMLVTSEKLNNMEELQQIKNDLLTFDFVDDIVYDQKAYKMFFDQKNLLYKYKEIFKIIFFVISFLFVLKLLFFLIKNLYRKIMLEIGGGILLSVFSYMIICLITLFNQDSIFILNWQILYILIPFSFMLTLLTKESNV